MSPLAQHRRFTVEDFYRMSEAGILTEDDRVELIEGEIVEMTPVGSRHASVVDRLTQLLVRRLGGALIVRVQNPVRLAGESEPEPNIALLEPREDYYAAAHPGPRDVRLIVEVAESSRAYDRSVKVPLYARHGVPEVWVIDLEADSVERFGRPAGGEYRSATRSTRGGSVASESVPTLLLEVDEILGPP
jgi:Uma2 family endonuclease